MAQFENHPLVAEHIAREIERKLAVLGTDWRDAGDMARLAGLLMSNDGGQQAVSVERFSREAAVQDLRGLISVMLRTMEEGASEGRELHGNAAWKALARALWNERDKQNP